MPRPADPEVLRFLRRAYRDVWAYDLPDEDARSVARTGGAETYGEIGVAAAAALLSHLAPGPSDVLFDLGSGAGRFALHAALGTDAGKVVAVERARSRHRIACRIRKVALEAGLARAGRLVLRRADLMRVPLAEATMVYTCSTAFPEPFLARLLRRFVRLRPGTVVVSTAPLDPTPRLVLRTVLRLDMSWRRKCPTYVYERVPGPAARRKR